MKECSNHEVLLDGKKISYKNLYRLALGSCEHTFFGEFTIGEQKEFYERVSVSGSNSIGKSIFFKSSLVAQFAIAL